MVQERIDVEPDSCKFANSVELTVDLKKDLSPIFRKWQKSPLKCLFKSSFQA